MRHLLLALILLPVASAASWEDAGGDAGGLLPDGAMDLIALAVEEEPAGFAVTLTVADLAPTAGQRADAGRWFVHLDHGIERRIHIGRSVDGIWWSMLEEANAADADGYAWAASLPLERDEAAGTLTTFVERSRLADRDGAPPVAGRVLGGIRAESASHVGGMADRLPDEGVLSLPVTFGPEQRGSVRLSSQDPWRASNGAASTYVFSVTVRNEGAADDVELRAVDVPPEWSVLLPEPTVSLPAGGEAKVPVVLQTPFAHQHGARESFIVEARGQAAAEGEAGRVELGLEYLAVPQPSGHHSKLWFHSRSMQDPYQDVKETVTPGGYLSGMVMNALEEDDGDTLEPKEGRPINGPGQDDVAAWYVPLSPQLRMGLDFDLDRTGTVEVPVSAPPTMAEARLYGWLYRCVPANEAYDCDTLASLQGETTALDGDGILRANVVPQDAADRVPYAPQSYLTLSLYAASDRIQTATGLDQLEIQPGGWIELPLEEYADPVDDIFASDAVELRAVASELSVGAGATTAFQAVLDNRLAEGLDVELSLSGTHAEWARLEGSARRSLDALDRQEVRVVVSAPAGVAPGERADLILHARTEAGSSLVRLVATVTDAPAVAAEAPAAESPSGGALLALAAMIVVLLRRR